MSKITTQQTHTLISLFLKEFKEKYGREPVNFNRYRDKWGFQSMAEDLGIDRAKEVISYYFETNRVGHPTSYLMNNYDKISERMREREEDVIIRKRLMEESAKRVEEWRAKRGK